MNQILTEELIRYKNNEMTGEEEIVFFQKLIDSGMAWTLKGPYWKIADAMIASGICRAKKEDDGKHKFYAAWTIQDALALLPAIAPDFLLLGFAVGLTGSVLTKGSSSHDLDIILYPLQSTTHVDWDDAREGLLKAGFVLLVPASQVQKAWRAKGFPDEKTVEIWTYQNKRVDVFFLR